MTRDKLGAINSLLLPAFLLTDVSNIIDVSKNIFKAFLNHLRPFLEVMRISNVPSLNGPLLIGNRIYFGAIFHSGVTYEPNRSSLAIGRKRNATGKEG